MLFLTLCSLLSTPATDTVRARIVASIGDDSPAHPYSFGKVTGFTFDAAGRLYVSDRQDAQVVVFDQGGRKVGVIGRKGEGPGEFTAPMGPVIASDGALYVRNMVFMERFVADPRTGLPGRFDHAFDGPTFAPWLSMRATVIDSAGRYYFPLEGADGTTHRPVRAFVRYTREGRVVDTLPIPQYPTEPAPWASVMVNANSGRTMAGLNIAPFEAQAAWAVTGSGTLLSGDGISTALREVDRTGRVLRTIEVGGTGRRIPERQRAESLAALKRRIDSLPVPLEQVRGTSQAVRDQRLPATYPPYTGLLVVGPDLWVRRWAPEGHTWFDRFTLAGGRREAVDLPVECANDPLPVVRDQRVACLTVDRETGAESVAILELPRR